MLCARGDDRDDPARHTRVAHDLAPSVGAAKLAVAADHISGGRVELGIGTGWWEAEHRVYGFSFPPLKVRMDRLSEQLEIIRGSWAPGPFTCRGQHWSVEDLDAQPKPVQQPHPRLIMGGAAGPRSAALAARFAAECNLVHADPQTVVQERANLDAACEAANRDRRPSACRSWTASWSARTRASRAPAPSA